MIYLFGAVYLISMGGAIFIMKRRLDRRTRMDNVIIDRLNTINTELVTKVTSLQSLAMHILKADDMFVETYGHIKYEIATAPDLATVKAECQEVLDLITTRWRVITI